MKKFVFAFLVLLLLCALAQAETIVSFTNTRGEINGGFDLSLGLTAVPAFEEDTIVTIHCEEAKKDFEVLFPAGETKFVATIPTEKVGQRTPWVFSVKKGNGYTVNGSAYTVTLYSMPRAEFYLQIHEASVGKQLTVILQCMNTISVLPDRNIFELRDQNGRVFGRQAWTDPTENLTFRFEATADMVGKHEFSLWLDDVCVTAKTGYGCVVDLSKPVISQPDTHGEPYMAITIDCAYYENQTDAILAVLDKYNVKATFFMTGYFIREFTDSARKIVEAGHEVGNHSNTHPHMTEMTSEYDIIRQIQRPAEDLKLYLGVTSRLFRPPFGEFNSMITAIARAEGQEVTLWTIDSHDWDETYTQDQVIRRVKKDVGPGTIILFHLDGFNTPNTLDQVIPYYQNELGLTLVTIPELLEISGDELPDLPD